MCFRFYHYYERVSESEDNPNCFMLLVAISLQQGEPNQQSCRLRIPRNRCHTYREQYNFSESDSLEYLQACDEFDKHLLYDKGKAYYDGPKYYDNQLFMYLTQKLQESNERLERGEVLGRVFPRTKTGSESHPSGFTPVSQGTNDQQTGERLLSALVYIDAHHNDGLRFRDMIDISSFTHLLTSGYCTLGNGLWTWSVIRKDAAINNNNDELNSFETTSYSSGGGIIRVNYNFNSEPAITLHTENTAAFNAVISSNF